MTSAPSDRYRHWCKNLGDVSRKVYASLKIAPVTLRSSSSLQSAIDLYRKNRGRAAAVAFLVRYFERTPVPTEYPLTSLGASVGKMHMARSANLDRLDETELTRLFNYISLGGPLLRNCLVDILTQLFGNSWNTRGQKASLVGS